MNLSFENERRMRQRIRRQRIELTRLNRTLERQALFIQAQSHRYLIAYEVHQRELAASKLCPACTRRRRWRAVVFHWRYRIRGWVYGYTDAYKHAYEKGKRDASRG